MIESVAPVSTSIFTGVSLMFTTTVIGSLRALDVELLQKNIYTKDQLGLKHLVLRGGGSGCVCVCESCIYAPLSQLFP